MSGRQPRLTTTTSVFRRDLPRADCSKTAWQGSSVSMQLHAWVTDTDTWSISLHGSVDGPSRQSQGFMRPNPTTYEIQTSMYT